MSIPTPATRRSPPPEIRSPHETFDPVSASSALILLLGGFVVFGGFTMLGGFTTSGSGLAAAAVGVVTVSVGGALIGPTPAGVVASALALLTTFPARISASVTVCGESAVHVTLAPGANGADGHDTAPTIGSVTLGSVNVTLPVFVNRNEYPIVSPRSTVLPTPSGCAVFTNDNDPTGPCSTVIGGVDASPPPHEASQPSVVGVIVAVFVPLPAATARAVIVYTAVPPGGRFIVPVTVDPEKLPEHVPGAVAVQVTSVGVTADGTGSDRSAVPEKARVLVTVTVYVTVSPT